MRVTMLEDRKVTVDGVNTIDAAAGETHEMGPGVAASLVAQGAGEYADPHELEQAVADEPEHDEAVAGLEQQDEPAEEPVAEPEVEAAPPARSRRKKI